MRFDGANATNCLLLPGFDLTDRGSCDATTNSSSSSLETEHVIVIAAVCAIVLLVFGIALHYTPFLRKNK